MKYAKRLLVLLLLIMPVLSAAQMPANTTIVAQVPFEFMAGNKYIPAGECVVQSMPNGAGDAVVIRNIAESVSVFSAALPVETRQPSSNFVLKFHEYGGRYFLAGIELAGHRMMYRLPESKAEQELRAQNVSATDKTLLAVRK